MTTESKQTPANPIEHTRTVLAQLTSAVDAGQLTYLADRALAQKQLAIAMSDALGGDKYRKVFLLNIFGKLKTSELSDEEFSALWHWCKPFTDPETHHWCIGQTSRLAITLVMREVMFGLWVSDEGQVAEAYE